MKAVVLKIGVLILIHLTTSCQKAIIDSRKNELTIIKNKDINKKPVITDSVITDSDNLGFIGGLIESQKVVKGDTNLSGIKNDLLNSLDNLIKKFESICKSK